ncbi:MAG: YncE family protein, partial [Nitrospirota bacterium]|nr:YncE family protein [Nitrospirota bacterium]
EPGLTSLMIYVTNEDSHNVYAINRQTNEVEATILVGKGPRGIAVNTVSTDKKIFVANSEANSISVIDARRNLVETEMPLRFGREPVAVAVARLSLVSENIYIANYRSNNVSVMDGRTYQEIDRVDVGNGPIDVAADPPVETAAASSLSVSDMETLRNYRQRYMNVYVANKNDRSISVLKVNTSSGRTEGVTAVPVEWTPVKLFVDYPSATVYGVHRDCDCISAINIIQLIRGNVKGAVSYIRFVGLTGTDLAVDKTMNRIYFLKESPAEILVLRPLQSASSMAAGAPSMLGMINAGTRPRSLALDPESRKLYLLDSATESLMVIDKATRQQEKIIPLGRRPYGISMFID